MFAFLVARPTLIIFRFDDRDSSRNRGSPRTDNAHAGDKDREEAPASERRSILLFHGTHRAMFSSVLNVDIQ